MVRYTISSGPSAEIMTAAEAKAHLNIDTTDFDTYIGTLITAARQWVEQYCDLCLINTTLVEYLDEFPTDGSAITLTKSPVSSITSIAYLDTAGASQTWSSALYRKDLIQKPCRIAPIYGEDYPSTYATTNAITITYVAGFGSASTNVPNPIIHACKLLLADMFENRETRPSGGSDTVKRLLDNYRVQMF